MNPVKIIDIEREPDQLKFPGSFQADTPDHSPALTERRLTSDECLPDVQL